MSEAPELHIKCRPSAFKDVIGQPDAVRMLVELVKSKRVPHALLFVGPSGVGKTTLARILREKLNCVVDRDFQELNCADVRGIDAIREISKRMDHAALKTGGVRIWLLDEAHRLTGDAQSILLKMLEDTPRHVYFMLATTDPGKLIKTVRSRCTTIALKPVSREDLITLVRTTWSAEAGEPIEADNKVVSRIAEAAEGSPRLALNFLNKVIGLKTEAEQLAAIMPDEVKEQAFELVRMLLWKRGKVQWAELAKIIAGINEDPEQMRRLILANATKEILKGNDNAGRAYAVICAFEGDFFASGKSGLCRAAFEVFSGE